MINFFFFTVSKYITLVIRENICKVMGWLKLSQIIMVMPPQLHH